MRAARSGGDGERNHAACGGPSQRTDVIAQLQTAASYRPCRRLATAPMTTRHRELLRLGRVHLGALHGGLGSRTYLRREGLCSRDRLPVAARRRGLTRLRKPSAACRCVALRERAAGGAEVAFRRTGGV